MLINYFLLSASTAASNMLKMPVIAETTRFQLGISGVPIAIIRDRPSWHSVKPLMPLKMVG